jgi:hypothetical protein
MLKPMMLGGIVFFLALVGCAHSRDIDTEAARKLSDAFMSDWIGHLPDSAFEKMEPAFAGTVNRSDFAQQLEKLSNYCGWPLDSELKDTQSGFTIYADGHRNSTRKFICAATTT